MKYKLSLDKFSKFERTTETHGIGERAGTDKKGHYIRFDEELMDDAGYYTGKVSGAEIYGKKIDDSLIFDLDKIKYYGSGAKDRNMQDYNYDKLYGLFSESDLGAEKIDDEPKKRSSLTILQSRKGTKGWRSESQRHALARKGIKTGRKRKGR